ncbi:LytTR family DNA-binding domain-containing protein [Vibrio tritonius]|uniref:LytTR family DNA-binding domain-containing protein n=1 Tax=Vibrio tritonius TaxID=1435069 RepID=A0ABS7YS24_9VIBR|nr:LytTR family DNA-binding domain-containing protein [Vibrio tritonius]MCA2017239.1 LytTR family DNA-binding domain-containing protein [Vibrio tritonius]
MLKALIVEDEYLAREELTYLVQTYSQIEVVAAFDDGLEAFKYLQQNKVDVVFLDINIPSIDGMLLARNIHQFSQKPHIVFTTAYKEFAVDAFELEAFDYLLKPLNEERVQRLLSKLESVALANEPVMVEEAIESRPDTINLMKDNRICVTPVEEVRYAEAQEKITLVFTADGEFSVPYSISELMEKLPENQFFRCHRSYCVNLKCIAEIIPWMNSTYMLKLHDIKEKVPVSRGNIKAFREMMHL